MLSSVSTYSPPFLREPAAVQKTGIKHSHAVAQNINHYRIPGFSVFPKRSKCHRSNMELGRSPDNKLFYNDAITFYQSLTDLKTSIVSNHQKVNIAFGVVSRRAELPKTTILIKKSPNSRLSSCANFCAIFMSSVGYL